MRNLASAILDHAAAHGGRRALVSPIEARPELTFGELGERVARLRNGLLRERIGAGDRGLTHTSWLVLGRRLARRGFDPLYGTTYFSLQSVRTSAEQLRAFVESVCARTGAGQVDIVAHSMGGIVARYYIERLGGAARLRRLITIGSPHRGTRLGRWGLAVGARELDAESPLLTELAPPPAGMPYTSIWSRCDSVVVPQASASIAPLDDCVFDDLGHLSLLASRRVVDAIIERLRADRQSHGSTR